MLESHLRSTSGYGKAKAAAAHSTADEVTESMRFLCTDDCRALLTLYRGQGQSWAANFDCFCDLADPLVVHDAMKLQEGETHVSHLWFMNGDPR